MRCLKNIVLILFPFLLVGQAPTVTLNDNDTDNIIDFEGWVYLIR